MVIWSLAGLGNNLIAIGFKEEYSKLNSPENFDWLPLPNVKVVNVSNPAHEEVIFPTESHQARIVQW